MAILGERQDVSGGLVDGQAPSLKGRLGDDDLFSPGLASILTTTREKLFVSQGGENRSLERDDNVGVAYGLEERLDFHTGLAQKGTTRSLHRFFRASESCDEAGPGDRKKPATGQATAPNPGRLNQGRRGG